MLCNYLDNFCTTYLDNVLVYSKTLEDYKNYVCKVIRKLSNARLYLNINKSKFAIKEVKYLGLILIIEGIKIDTTKV